MSRGNLWEPFTAGAKHAVVRAQMVAHMFGSRTIGTEHLAFALAEEDDDAGRVLASAIERDAMREQLAGEHGAPPDADAMTFTDGFKSVIERASAEARMLDQMMIGTAHLSLGVLAAKDRPALAAGADPAAIRTELVRATEAGA